jgi:hypothetical protein
VSETGAPAAAGLGPRWAALSGRARTGLVLLAATLVHGVLQALLPGFLDVDAWYHSRFAEQLWTGGAAWHGLDFPWMAHSSYAEFPSDWALGWHWLLAPFCAALGPVGGMRAATAVFAGVLTAAVYAFLARRGVAHPLLWTALLVLGNPFWLYRTHMGRPTTLVVATHLLLLDQVLERRALGAGAAAALSMLVYAVPGAPVAAAGAGCMALLARDRRVPWKVGAAAVAGIAAGILLHPGFWSVRGAALGADRALFAVWAQMRDSIAGATAGGAVVTYDDGMSARVDVPLELLPMGWNTLLTQFWVPLASTALACAAAHRSVRSGRALATTLLAAVWLYASLRVGRFSEYWAPFALLAVAEAWGGPQAAWSPKRARAALAGVGLASVYGIVVLAGLPWTQHPGAEVRAAAAGIRSEGPGRDTVFHPLWDEFAPLFHWNQDVRWTTGFDPQFLVRHDPELFRALHHVVAGDLAPDQLHAVLRRHFDSRWVLLWRRPGPDGARSRRWEVLQAQLDAAPWATVTYEDEAAVVYRLDD